MKTQEFVLYEFYVTVTDWDAGHKAYGYTKATNREVAEILGCNTSTITRTRNKLIQKGWLIKDQDGTLRVKGFERWMNDYWKKIHDSGARKHRAYADVHNESAVLHKNEFGLVSYKEKVGGDMGLPDLINTAEDFEKACIKVFWEGDYESMCRASSSSYINAD
ncbi:MAG: hypothetical protein AAB783_01115 [Patescibacteria group bacterium]